MAFSGNCPPQRGYPSDTYRQGDKNTNLSTEAHVPSPRYGQYLTRAHNLITPEEAAMDSCFVLIRTHQHGISLVLGISRSLYVCFSHENG